MFTARYGLTRMTAGAIVQIVDVFMLQLVTPEASRIAIFSNGTCIGLNGWIPVGGKADPNSIPYMKQITLIL